jgi:hypothetical protein
VIIPSIQYIRTTHNPKNVFYYSTRFPFSSLIQYYNFSLVLSPCFIGFLWKSNFAEIILINQSQTNYAGFSISVFLLKSYKHIDIVSRMILFNHGKYFQIIFLISMTFSILVNFIMEMLYILFVNIFQSNIVVFHFNIEMDIIEKSFTSLSQIRLGVSWWRSFV